MPWPWRINTSLQCCQEHVEDISWEDRDSRGDQEQKANSCDPHDQALEG